MASFWYCCECSFGPHSVSLNSTCVQCDHRRCESCIFEKDSMTSSHSCHELSPYPSAPVHNHGASMNHRLLAPIDPTLSGPSIIRADVPGLSDGIDMGLGGAKMRSRPAYLYICCSCNDGPKLYNNQPRCVMCNHVACSNCQPVK